MDKSTMQTIAVIVAVFMAAWHISGIVSTNTATIAELRADITELRGALLAHIGGHSHAPQIALAAPESESEQS